MTDRSKLKSLMMPTPEHDPNDRAVDWDAGDEANEDEIPSAVLFVIAGLLVLAFALYIIVGGGHNHFH